VSAHGGSTTLTLALDSARLPLHADASARIGQKTPLGESFVDLDPGRRGRSPASGERIKSHPSVEMDEALSLLDGPGRRHLIGVTSTLARGAVSPGRIGAAASGLERTVDAANTLAQTLHGQEGQIAAAVTNSRRVLGVLGQHDASLRALVRDAHTTLAATDAQRLPLRAALEQLPSLMGEARATLADARPLLGEAQPAAAQLKAAAPALSDALAQLPPTLSAARSLIAHGPALQAAAEPALSEARAVLPLAGPALRRLGPALADIVPMVRYIAPRANTVAAWFANTADLGSHGDAKGKWARFFVLMDPSTAAGAGPAPPANSYTTPDDAARNQPYRPGDYPRLLPFTEALSPGSAARKDGP
jgi:phospholipid/cholesterol/gamma-HCH transport system substrate-binding protein